MLCIESKDLNSNPSLKLLTVEKQTPLKMLNNQFSLLKAIKENNTYKKWTLLIAPDNALDKTIFAHANIDPTKLLIIKSQHIYDWHEMLQQALRNNNFSAIIFWKQRSPCLSLTMFNQDETNTKLYCFDPHNQDKMSNNYDRDTLN